MHGTESRSRIVRVVVAFEAALGAVALALGAIFGVPILESLHLSARSVGWGIAASLPMLLVMGVLAVLPWAPMRSLLAQVRETLVPLFSACTVLHLALISVAAGVGEELLFRGLIQAAVTSKAGPIIGVLVASLLFAAGHALSRAYVVFAGLISIYLGVLFIVSGGLIVPIIAHALYDFVAMLYLVRDLPSTGSRGNLVGEPEQGRDDATI